jgi:hypothetical protein
VSTRVVEQELSWCSSKVEEFLAEHHYLLERTGPKGELLTGKYLGPEKHRMLYQPVVEVDFVSISPGATHVGVTFLGRWALIVRRLGFWCLVGFGPILVAAGIHPREARWVFLWGVAFLASAAWLLFVIIRVMLAGEAVDRHTKKVERQLWNTLDPDGTVSHQIVELSRTELNFFRALKWGSLCLGGIICFTIVVVVLLAISEPLICIMGITVVGAVFYVLLLAPFSFGWFSSSFSLPHRYHWKARFGVAYTNWWLIVCIPVLTLAGIGFLRALSLSLFGPQSVRGFAYPLLVVSMLGFIGVFGIFALFAVRAVQRKSSSDVSRVYFGAPSMRYEMLSTQLSTSDFQHLLKRHRFWTWAVFLHLTSVWYVAAGYVVVVLIEAVSGIFGAQWAIAQSWYWPVIVPMDSPGLSLQIATLVFLAGLPLFIIVTRSVRGQLNMKRRLNVGQVLAEGCTELGLPKGPLDFLKRKLEADKLQVALVPISEIDVRLERTAIFKKHYLLWVSVGARKQLSEKEIEALLWHECGHADLVKRKGRKIAAVLAPWAPGFLDLAEDLYEEERAADHYAVEKLGAPKHLTLALQKLKKQRRPMREKEPEAGGDRLTFLSWETVKALWSLKWVGYLHPDVDQRLRWLEDGKDKICGKA